MMSGEIEAREFIHILALRQITSVRRSAALAE